MEIREALTFDDVLLEPGASEVLPADVATKTRLTRTRWALENFRQRLDVHRPVLAAAVGFEVRFANPDLDSRRLQW